MLKKIPALLLHLAFFALVCATAAYWALKIVTPPPSAAPLPAAPPAPRVADPTLAARMFGLVQAAPIPISNIQIVGVFSAGKHSSAVLAVDGKPARVVLLGNAVTAGSKLVDVRADGVTLDNHGVRQDLRLPPRAPVATGGAPPPAGFTREGDTLTAPSAGGPVVPATGLPAAPGAPLRPMQPALQAPADALSPPYPPGAPGGRSQ